MIRAQRVRLSLEMRLLLSVSVCQIEHSETSEGRAMLPVGHIHGRNENRIVNA